MNIKIQVFKFEKLRTFNKSSRTLAFWPRATTVVSAQVLPVKERTSEPETCL